MKSPLRTRSLGTKLTEVEYAKVETAALRAGVGLSEWCRRAVLEHSDTGASNGSDRTLLAELLAFRAVVLNLMFRISTGERVSESEMRELIDRADRDKHRRAAAALSATESAEM